MIQILPMSDLVREKELLANLNLESHNKPKVLLMTERDKELGMVKLALRAEKLVIFSFELAKPCDFEDLEMEQGFYIDTLMRSAASYGETNGATKIETVNSIYNTFLKRRGFSIDENHAFTAMSTIVKYSKVN